MTASQRMIMRLQTKVAVLEERFGQRVGQLEEGQEGVGQLEERVGLLEEGLNELREGVGQLQEWQHQLLVRRTRLLRGLFMFLHIVSITFGVLLLHIFGYF